MVAFFQQSRAPYVWLCVSVFVWCACDISYYAKQPHTNTIILCAWLSSTHIHSPKHHATWIVKRCLHGSECEARRQCDRASEVAIVEHKIRVFHQSRYASSSSTIRWAPRSRCEKVRWWCGGATRGDARGWGEEAAAVHCEERVCAFKRTKEKNTNNSFSLAPIHEILYLVCTHVFVSL